jgi:Protein of unknown function (DUF2752)
LLSSEESTLPSNNKVRLLSGTYCALTVIGVVSLALLDPEETTFIPMCPCRLLTGFYCPGCGSLRAIHAITRLRIDRALGYNPLLVLFLPLFIWFFAINLATACRGPDKIKFRLPPAFGNALLIIILTYFVFRNIPAYPFSLLQPHSIQ